MKSLLTIWKQYQRIRDGWDKSKHDVRTFRQVRKIYSRYLCNIARANGLDIPENSDYMPGVAAQIAFPSDYWRRSADSINRSREFQEERARGYAREIYAA